MLSLQKKFLFVHVHKTAGNSIQSVLRHYSEDEIVASRSHQDGIERFGLRNSRFEIKKHSLLSDYRDALGPELFGNLYKFVCVRNPWDRMISFYFSPSRGVTTWDRKAFLKLLAQTRPVAEYLRLGQETDPFQNVDCVMRFENLAADFQSLCQRLNIPSKALPAYNQSSREHYSRYYDHDLRERVAQQFALDIAKFGYAFDRRDAQPTPTP